MIIYKGPTSSSNRGAEVADQSLFHLSFDINEDNTLAETDPQRGSQATFDRKEFTETCGHYFTSDKESAGQGPDTCPDIDAVAERRRHGPGTELITLGYEGSDIDYTRYSRRRKKKE